jgi:pimeloyl-ACP methyl ester carboxylesterase
MGLETRVASNRQYGDFDAVLMDGVGHFLHLERPAEFNARLREILATLE